MNHQCDILIVGAGMTGLTAAQALAQTGRQVTIVDKGRSVGGRLATRRIGPGLADHGAQFFTVRTPGFADAVQRWEAAGLVFRWATGWSDGSIAGRIVDGHPRYAVHGGMNALAKSLAAALSTAGVEIFLATELAAVAPAGTGWCATDSQGNCWQATTIVLTTPADQALALLAAGGAMLAPGQRAALDAIRYAPCLCGISWVEGAVLLPEPGAVQRHDAAVAWFADNRRKGISPGAQILTLHANPAWSTSHYTDSDELLTSFFAEELRRWAYGPFTVKEIQVKRWRYALPTVLFPQPFLRAEGLPPLYFGGDAYATPRVEGAFISGTAIGAAIAAAA